MITQLVARDLPEGAQLVALQLEEVALLALALHLRLDVERELLQLLARHGGRVDAIDNRCVENIADRDRDKQYFEHNYTQSPTISFFLLGRL